MNPTYTPLGVGDTIHFSITALGAGAGTMADMKRKRTIEMTVAHFFRYLQHKTGDTYTGAQSLRLQVARGSQIRRENRSGIRTAAGRKCPAAEGMGN